MLRMAGILFAAALLAAGMYDAAVRGLADAHYTSARLTLSEATPANGAPTAELLDSALASMREALALEPANPHFVERSAQLLDQRALEFEPGDPAMRENLRRSLAQYREAAAMRPGSPYVWASIAMLKKRLNELDGEFYAALGHADYLGPWEPQVQIAMIDVGLATWRRLAREGRQRVLGALDRALLRQAAEVRRVVTVHGTLALVCAEGQLPPRVAAYCVKK